MIYLFFKIKTQPEMMQISADDLSAQLRCLDLTLSVPNVSSCEK